MSGLSKISYENIFWNNLKKNGPKKGESEAASLVQFRTKWRKMTFHTFSSWHRKWKHKSTKLPVGLFHILDILIHVESGVMIHKALFLTYFPYASSTWHERAFWPHVVTNIRSLARNCASELVIIKLEHLLYFGIKTWLNGLIRS
jgi:hypothetical protein